MKLTKIVNYVTTATNKAKCLARNITLSNGSVMEIAMHNVTPGSLTVEASVEIWTPLILGNIGNGVVKSRLDATLALFLTGCLVNSEDLAGRLEPVASTASTDTN